MRCIKCIVRKKSPGVLIGKDGVCNICSNWQEHSRYLSDFKHLEGLLQEKINRVKGKFPYDVLVGVSGGKDGSYLCHALKEHYGLKVLAATIDYGFMPNAFTKTNLQNIIEKLKIDHYYITLPGELVKKLFKTYLSRFNTVTACNFCTSQLAFSIMTREAIEKRVPLVAWGLDRAQLFSKFHLPYARARVYDYLAPYSKEKSEKKLARAISKGKAYFNTFQLSGEELNLILPRQACIPGTDVVPESIAYFLFNDHNEETIKQELIRKYGWIRPAGDDSHGHFDCELKTAFAYAAHAVGLADRLEYELSASIREGKISREASLERLERDEKQLASQQRPYKKLEEILGLKEKWFQGKIRFLSILAPLFAFFTRLCIKIFGYRRSIEKMIVWIRPH